MPAQYTLPAWIDRLTIEDAVKLLLLQFTGGTAPSGGGGGGIPITPSSGTLTLVAATAGSSTVIPVGAFNIGIIFLTGTGTVNAVDLPVGLPLNIDSKTAATITVTCGSPGTARISYLT